MGMNGEKLKRLPSKVLRFSGRELDCQIETLNIFWHTMTVLKTLKAFRFLMFEMFIYFLLTKSIILFFLLSVNMHL